jgi:hypothetical protein
MEQRFKPMKHARRIMPGAAPPESERASPMPNANTKVKTRAARPTLSVLKKSLKPQTLLALSDEARAAAGQGALLPEAHQRLQAYELACRLAQARAPIAPGHEPRFARLAQVLGLDEPRRVAKSA